MTTDEMRREFERMMRDAGANDLAFGVYALPEEFQPAYSDPTTKAKWDGFAAGRAAAGKDTGRLDWLEHMANQPGGILLRDGGDFTGRLGLGLRRIGRSLRAAIDAANTQDRSEM